MSTYLSPIVSSGDSTPIEQLVGNNQTPATGRDNDSSVEYPTRELKIQSAAHQKKQVGSPPSSRKQTSVLKSQKSIRSMGNSMMLDDSSDSDSPSGSDANESDLDEDRSLSQIQRNRLRYMAQSNQQQANKKVNIFNQQRPEQVAAGGAKNQCLADKFLVATQQQQQAHDTTTNMNATATAAAATAAATNRPKRHSSSASSSSSLINCSETCENTTTTSKNNQHQHHTVFGPAGAHKKFKQILQSIPMVPLVATTSLMTILILCFVLLLTSDSLPMRATAKLHRPSAATVAQGDTTATGLEGPQMQSLVMGGAPEVDELAIENFVKQQDSAAAAEATAPARIANLRRELLDDLIAQQQPAFMRAAALRQRGGGGGGGHLRIASSVASDGHQRGPKSKRGPEQAGGSGGGENAGLFDSLGSMLFGAASQQQQTRSMTASSGEEDELEVAGAGRDEPADSEAAYLDGGPAVGPGARPAHLRSSALELQLPDEEQADRAVDYQQQQQQQPPQMRARSTTSQLHSNRQHAGKHAHNPNQQHVAAAGQQRPTQQQQQQQSVASGNHERPFDVAQVQCNNTEEGFERFACPTPDSIGRYKCIEDRLFCDGYYDCPGREDEDQVSCMYYRLFVSHIDILTNTFLTWMKSQNRQANGAGGGATHSQQQQSHHHHRQTTHMTTNGLDLGSSM